MRPIRPNRPANATCDIVHASKKVGAGALLRFVRETIVLLLVKHVAGALDGLDAVDITVRAHQHLPLVHLKRHLNFPGNPDTTVRLRHIVLTVEPSALDHRLCPWKRKAEDASEALPGLVTHFDHDGVANLPHVAFPRHRIWAAVVFSVGSEGRYGGRDGDAPMLPTSFVATEPLPPASLITFHRTTAPLSLVPQLSTPLFLLLRDPLCFPLRWMRIHTTLARLVALLRSLPLLSRARIRCCRFDMVTPFPSFSCSVGDLPWTFPAPLSLTGLRMVSDLKRTPCLLSRTDAP
mmetsp:Transcript_18780/g.43339  ORF Transcript_18780/g.43339 Transcript_18780/m.43339 type:complete len:292 (+) Transcript_18780:296-1171(+)